ncbi:hypothetical protein BDP55DRAFT_717425 [Colletotrichum godetiae]|uniref:Uncharacterized protein n=1 Tax=Colletotrichum godetiae TaxID=1209918 RepID=A0AAJ0AG35_9PEZI|nr:uncharacterized protein BDP55DRAFT_717425 [Colletotrichum godetiae]KAK1673257.1 hypothetical protein BDP55DRAFT_717425 [Colletotrichum godetiae]
MGTVSLVTADILAHPARYCTSPNFGVQRCVHGLPARSLRRGVKRTASAPSFPSWTVESRWATGKGTRKKEERVRQIRREVRPPSRRETRIGRGEIAAKKTLPLENFVFGGKKNKKQERVKSGVWLPLTPDYILGFACRDILLCDNHSKRRETTPLNSRHR